MKFSVSPVGTKVTATPFVVVVDLENPISKDSVTISVGTNPGSGVLSGTLTKAAVNGVVLFDDLEIDTDGIGYTLVATAQQQRYGITAFAPVGQFQPGVASAAANVAFQAGYYYNYPPCGTTLSENTVGGNYPHPNLNPGPVLISVTSNPFDVAT